MEDRKAEGGVMVKQGKVAKQLRRARRKIRWLQQELAQAKEPYELPDRHDLLWVHARDLKRLVSLACQVNDDYEVPWFQRVLAANGPTLDGNLQLILNALPALKKLLDFPGPLPPRGICQILEKERCIRAA